MSRLHDPHYHTVNPQEFDRIMTAEANLCSPSHSVRNFSRLSHLICCRGMAPFFQSEAEHLAEFARNSLEQRSYIASYGLDRRANGPVLVSDNGVKHHLVHESVAAHTNLLRELVDHALVYHYGPDFGDPSSQHPLTHDRYTYREVLAAVGAHDLPENQIGDIADNGSSLRAKKPALEATYLDQYFHKYRTRYGNSRANSTFCEHVRQLLADMDSQRSHTGRLLYTADKTAAVFATLFYDAIGSSPLRHPSDPTCSDRDRAEITLCDESVDGYARASEMWTLDHFHIRQIIQYDDTSFFTALIVTYTLMVHGHWYNWRERDYHS